MPGALSGTGHSICHPLQHVYLLCAGMTVFSGTELIADARLIAGR